ncbi:C4-hydroxylase [Puccinia sorghi]|uniref:C4-hydroxylase n=1 Tax=Puccinia sorghi TaxID=27349 RepID=A0A0L6VIQ4_9BASI|nr:C4-hydroxylase [Puccinia sorghi]
MHHYLPFITHSTLLNNTIYDQLTQSILPQKLQFPLYHFHREEIIPGLTDPALTVIVPLLAYWLVSIFFTALDYLELPWIEKYRLHEPAEVSARNKVSPAQVIKAVIIQQLIQTALGIFYLDSSPSDVLSRDYLAEMKTYAPFVSSLVQILLPPQHARWLLINHGQSLTQWAYWWGLPILQFLWASFVLDTWQYFWHRAFHINQFLYKHIHSVHHRLYCPYSFGALYNHPLEGFILDTLGAVIAHLVSGMSVRQATVLFGISTAKTVDDHCGLALPFDPFQHLFGNNAAYHDIHHQQFGIKKNFSQPYFVHWDVLMGTRMTSEEAQLRRDKISADRLPSLPSPTSSSSASSVPASLSVLDSSEDSDADSKASPKLKTS